MSQNTNPNCPNDCTYELPVTSFDICRSDIHTGEIEILYLAGPDAECFTDVESLAEWTARVSNTSLDPDAIRRIRVIGDMPVGTSDPIDISLGQKFYPEKDFTINLETEDTSDANYALMRFLECGGQVKAWTQTAGGDGFGGICGMDVNINTGYQIERGQGSIHKIIFTLTFKAKHTPERFDHPLAT